MSSRPKFNAKRAVPTDCFGATHIIPVSGSSLFDGAVVRAGSQAQWAFRGFNPHHRKDKSYYPLLAHVAQTGQILRLKNRVWWRSSRTCSAES